MTIAVVLPVNVFKLQNYTTKASQPQQKLDRNKRAIQMDQEARDRYLNDPATRIPLNPDFYDLKQDEFEFFQKLTGITDEEELKSYILAVQAKAYEIYGYPCIRSFAFTRLKVARVPGYKSALKLLEQRETPIFLDIGCCFGNDIRKVVLDGWPVENVIASDLNPGFWNCGHELFKSTPQTFPAAFIGGDVFDPTFLAPADPAAIVALSDDKSATPPLSLGDLRSLDPLRGKISAIFAGAFFHLFDEEKQLQLALLLASLLSPEKGSVIFGQHGSEPVKGFRDFRLPVDSIHTTPGDDTAEAALKVRMFCHSPESWKDMWIKQVFGQVEDKDVERVKVEVELIARERKDLIDAVTGAKGKQFYLMNWCITRL